MDWRQTKEEQTYWYARMGAISKQHQLHPTNGTSRELAMRFMDICDEKGDFSYIFSSASREGDIDTVAFPSVCPARRWRPLPDRDPTTGFWKLSAIVPAHNHGSQQPGELQSDGQALMLQNIAIYAVQTRTKLSPSTLKWFSTWMKGEVIILRVLLMLTGLRLI